MIKILVAGFNGRMGQAAVEMILAADDFELAGVYDPAEKGKNLNERSAYADSDVPIFKELAECRQAAADIWLDFTVPAVAYTNTRFALENGLSPVVGTTGITDEQLLLLKEIAKKRQLGGLIAPNFALGAVLMMQFAQKAAAYFSDVEIIEYHHDNKLDAPSGTALKTAEMISEVRRKKIQGQPSEQELLAGARGADYEGMKLHSVRLPGLVAHQQVQFGSAGEGLTIRHDSYDRTSFMTGVAFACRKVKKLSELIDGLEKIL